MQEGTGPSKSQCYAAVFRHFPSVVAFAVALCGCASHRSTAHSLSSSLRSTEEKLGPLPVSWDMLWKVSIQNGSHFACVADKAGKQVVFVDGHPSQPFDRVSKDTPIFSRDGTRVAYAARLGPDWFVFVDGKPQSPYDFVYTSTLQFSLDGQHVIYAALKGGKCFIVVDGRPHQALGPIGELAIVNAAKGLRIAYVTGPGRSWVVVVDGKPSPEYSCVVPESLMFSADGNHVAYQACGEEDFFVVMDGRPQTKFDHPIHGLAFTPKGHLVYEAVNASDKWVVVIDGDIGPPSDDIIDGTMEFHDDGHVEYLVRRDNVLYRVKQFPIER